MHQEVKLKVLIVCSGNSGKVSPFVSEQVEALKNYGIHFEFYLIVGKGITGYLLNIKKLRERINSFKPDLIHSHYGLSGFITVFASRGYPTICTFHGTDINQVPFRKINFNRILSKFVYHFSDYSIFVSQQMADIIKAKTKYSIIPCHVDLKTFYPLDKNQAKRLCNLSSERKYILFSSSFSNAIKNYPLAKKAVDILGNHELIELQGLTREEVNFYLNSSECALVTSLSEGSSQFVKEALASNRPIVSTRVGDTSLLINGVEGCFLADSNVKDIADKLINALDYGKNKLQTNGRKKIMQLGLDSDQTTSKIYKVYSTVLNRN